MTKNKVVNYVNFRSERMFTVSTIGFTIEPVSSNRSNISLRVQQSSQVQLEFTSEIGSIELNKFKSNFKFNQRGKYFF